MKKIAFYTLGCKVNQYETDAMKQMFSKKGYEIVDFLSLADIYIINTCTVTAMSDKKSRQMINRAKRTNKEAKVIITGCMAEELKQQKTILDGVDLIVGNEDRSVFFASMSRSINSRKLFISNLHPLQFYYLLNI